MICSPRTTFARWSSSRINILRYEICLSVIASHQSTKKNIHDWLKNNKIIRCKNLRIPPPIIPFVMQILHHTTSHTILYIFCHYCKMSVHPSASTWFIFIHNTWWHIWILVKPVVCCFDKDLFVIWSHMNIIGALPQILPWMIVTSRSTTWIMIKLTPFNVFTRNWFEFIIPKLHTKTIKHKKRVTLKKKINKLIKN